MHFLQHCTLLSLELAFQKSDQLDNLITENFFVKKDKNYYV